MASGPTLHQPLRSKVSNYLNEQRRTGQFCDLIIEIENGAMKTSFPCHFSVVGAQSSFIGNSQFLQQHFSIKNPLKITIHNFHCAICLQTVVDFFYEDVVAVAKDHLTHFRTLANILSVSELLALYNTPQSENNVPTDESKEMTSISVSETAETTDRPQTTFTEEQNYFKLKTARPVAGSNKTNYCIGCDFTTYRVADMINHMSSCEASHLTCSLCEIGFLSWREYDTHLRKHSVDMKKPFFCLECNTRFMTRAGLIVHQPKHTTEKTHRCLQCGKGFKWKHGLANHLLIHKKEKLMLCDVCGYSTIHMKALKSHKLKHTEEYFRCPHPGCKHKANRKENLKLHIETHKQERPFVCEICGCKFSQSKNLKRHAIKHDTTLANRHQCQLCSFGSHRSDKLKEHFQRVHTEKAVQLELPEIVDNAFESCLEDGFNLPPIGLIDMEPDHKRGKIPPKRKQRRKANSSIKGKIVKKERVILPKLSIKSQNLNDVINTQTFLMDSSDKGKANP